MADGVYAEEQIAFALRQAKSGMLVAAVASRRRGGGRRLT